jgi:hypothetical protein
MRATTTISAATLTDPVERGYRAAEIWIRYLLEKRSIPAIPVPPAYYLAPADVEAIAARLASKGIIGEQSWLSCTKNDISSRRTPQLILGNELEEKSSSVENLPERDLIDAQPLSEVMGQLEEVDSVLEAK